LRPSSRCRRAAGTRTGQRFVQAAKHEIVHQPAIAKAHFVLGRMHVDIDAPRIDFEKQHEARMPAVIQHIGVGLPYRVRDQAIAHRAAVDVEILLVGAGARGRRQPDPAMQAQAGAAVFDRQALPGEAGTQRLANAHQPLAVRSDGPVMTQRAAIVADTQFHIGAGQRQRAQPLFDMAQLGTFGFQKPAPRRHVVEQLAHLDRGAGRVRVRRQRRCAATGHFQPRAVRSNRLPRGEGEAADRGNRGQRFATKTHGGDLFQIIEAGDLAGGVARYRQCQFIGGKATAIVAHTDQAYPALFQIDIQARGASIERVFDQLLDHRGRALDHFTGGNLVDQYVGQLPDGHVRLTGSAVAKSVALKVVTGLRRNPMPSSVMRQVASERLCWSGSERHVHRACQTTQLDRGQGRAAAKRPASFDPLIA